MKLSDRIFRRDKQPLTWRRKLLLATMFIVPVLAIAAIGNRGLFKRVTLERESGALHKQVQNEQKTSDSLRVQIGKLKNDALEIERVARERYGMARPGETVYKVR